MTDTARFVGWDFTDPFARSPRPVDEAVLDAQGRVRFSQRSWPRADARQGLDPRALEALSHHRHDCCLTGRAPHPRGDHAPVHRRCPARVPPRA